MRNLLGGILLSLLLLLQGCAKAPVANEANEPVRCLHPLIDARTNGGLAKAVLLYSEALDQCNALNGFNHNEEGR